MANNNRDELNSAVTSTLVATVNLGILNPFLINELSSSVVFDKDVIAAETPGGGSVLVDFSNKDTATVSTAVSLAVSFTGLQNGAVKYLAITKQAANAISFVGATDVSMRKAHITKNVTLAVYRISNKNGAIYAESVNIDNDVNGNTVTKFFEMGFWNMSTATGVSFIQITLASLGIATASIRGLSAIVLSDSGEVNSLEGTNNSGLQGGAIETIGVNLVITRAAGGRFDSTSFNNGAINRGYLKIEYIP